MDTKANRGIAVVSRPEASADELHQTQYQAPGSLSLAAVCLTGTAGALVFGLKPILVAAYVSAGHVSEPQAGMLVGFDMGALCLGNVLVSWRLYEWNRTRLAVAALLVIAMGNLVSMFAGSFVEMSAARAITGFGSGVATGMMAAAFTNMPNTDGKFGLYLVITPVIAAVASWWSASLLEAYGMRGMFAGLALLALPPMALAAWFPPLRALKHISSPGTERHPIARVTVVGACLVVFATALYYVAVGGTWAFIAQLAIARGMPVNRVGDVVGMALVAGGAGALVPLYLRDRIGRAVPIACSVMIMLVSLTLLQWLQTPRDFTVAICGLMFGWTLVFPYIMGLCSRLDPIGRLGALCFGASAAAGAIGPTIAGFLIEMAGYTTLLHLAVAGVAISGVVLLCAVRIVRAVPQPWVA